MTEEKIKAIYAKGINKENPLSQLAIGYLNYSLYPNKWEEFYPKAGSLNHHDLWSLQGQSLTSENTPMILGTDSSGLTKTGASKIVYPVIGSPYKGDETLNPSRQLLSEKYMGTLATKIRVPSENLIDKPDKLSHEQAACLPTAYLTAWAMLTVKAQVQPGETILVQGSGGGVSTALIVLGKSLGLKVIVTSRTDQKLEYAEKLGADKLYKHNEKLNEEVDAVMETVGESTWHHSINSLKLGGKLVIAGATSGSAPVEKLNRIFYMQLQILGCTLGSKDEFKKMIKYVSDNNVPIPISEHYNMDESKEGFLKLQEGKTFGKIVIQL